MGRPRTTALGVAAVLAAAAVVLAALSLAGVAELPSGWWSSGSESERTAVPDTDPGTDPGTDGQKAQHPVEIPPPPGLLLPAPRPAAPVLGPAGGPRTDAAAVRARLAPLLADDDLGRHAGVVVRDLARDQPVLVLGGGGPYIPASTLKLFTAAAALSELGPDHRFTTSVVLAGAIRRQPSTVVLVGGGDPLLAAQPPGPGEAAAPEAVSVAALAADTVRGLRGEGIRRVRVGYDARLFSGPAAAPSWEPDYVPGDIVSPISALWVDGGQVDPAGDERSADPALAAGQAFADALRRRGLVVLGGPRAVPAPAGATVLAERAGADLESVVEHMLLVSDNEAAEVLLRHVGLATGRQGSFAGGVWGVREVLTGLGVPYAGVRTYDGSGLSRANRVTRAALAHVLQLGADPGQPALRAVIGGLPVARFTGSLAYRFTDPATAAGRGVVRAKTGTLSRVDGLAGAVVTRDGALLGFGMLTDAVPLVDTLDARLLLEEMAAALAGCGCRR